MIQEGLYRVIERMSGSGRILDCNGFFQDNGLLMMAMSDDDSDGATVYV